MNPEVKEKWITALNSGEYSQTKDCLRDNSGYCCLGVLTDLAIKSGLDLEWEFDSGYVATCFDEDGYKERHEVVLPWIVMEWAELGSTNPSVVYEGSHVPISDPNDNGMPFSEIAKLIEGQL